MKDPESWLIDRVVERLEGRVRFVAWEVSRRRWQWLDGERWTPMVSAEVLEWFVASELYKWEAGKYWLQFEKRRQRFLAALSQDGRISKPQAQLAEDQGGRLNLRKGDWKNGLG